MSKYWEEEVEMYSPEEMEECYNSREDETVERDLDRRNGHGPITNLTYNML